MLKKFRQVTRENSQKHQKSHLLSQNYKLSRRKPKIRSNWFKIIANFDYSQISLRMKQNITLLNKVLRFCTENLKISKIWIIFWSRVLRYPTKPNGKSTFCTSFDLNFRKIWLSLAFGNKIIFSINLFELMACGGGGGEGGSVNILRQWNLLSLNEPEPKNLLYKKNTSYRKMHVLNFN